VGIAPLLIYESATNTTNTSQKLRIYKNMVDLIYKDLSYVLNGIFFEAYNYLGKGHKEKAYCDIIIQLLKESGMTFVYQYKIPIMYHNREASKRYFDFFIDNKIVVETKVGNKPSGKDFEQIKEYLRLSGLELGLLVMFRDSDVKIFRVLNPDKKNDSA
jgi:GxxExxY protein